MKTLLLDFDRALPRDLKKRVGFLCDIMGWKPEPMRITRSSGGQGWHVRVPLSRRVMPEVIIAAQAICGSDWKRETFNLRRCRALRRGVPRMWRSRANVLYSAKL